MQHTNRSGLLLEQMLQKVSLKKKLNLPSELFQNCSYVIMDLLDLPHSSLQGATSTDTGGRKRGSIGDKIKQILIKVWIWVVAVMLFVIGLGGGDKVVLYRIVYMALFLIFILTFQVTCKS